MTDRGDRRLATMKWLLDVAAERFDAMTNGQDHPRIDTARTRIETASAAVARAAGGLSSWTRTWLGMAVAAVGAWTAATVSGGLIGVTIVVVLGLYWPMFTLHNVLADRVNRRRTRRPEPPPEISMPAGLDPADQVLRLLWAARDELRGEMRQRAATDRFGYVGRTATGFDWLRRRNGHLAWLTRADRSVCQAIHSIEIWLDALDHDR
ncbi:hypothetical protein [Phytohabitans rumicis]|uniref:Uncharacterized protein n=1 Tax=Phytohabitans rumicis TaxID=1076125 RepID=A0A6V8L777_9ACTN|nr:hypothetical protein [Phytohabitans rumicis]GFJ90499.1 hypothetical protein Prum_041410 [Phytohabitans rumicis]